MAYSGANTYGIEKIRGIFKYLDYGSSPVEQIAPALGYASDILEIATKPDFVPEDDETINVDEWVYEGDTYYVARGDIYNLDTGDVIGHWEGDGETGKPTLNQTKLTLPFIKKKIIQGFIEYSYFIRGFL